MRRRSADYVIVGAGAAGCVLANRLSEDSSVSVLLIEAGHSDRHPLFHVPKGVPLLMARAKNLWAYGVTTTADVADQSRYWLRGKVLGGSTSVNGLMYVRGRAIDFDTLAEQAGPGWDWSHIGKAYAELEAHELGAAPNRGAAGPLRISLPGPDLLGPWHETVMAAGEEMGLARAEDTNQAEDAEIIGLGARTSYKGRRQSAAVAFLRPARRRRNLTIVTGALVDKVIFEDRSAVGVSFQRRGDQEIAHADREVILAAGAMASPGILERSGVGGHTHSARQPRRGREPARALGLDDAVAAEQSPIFGQSAASWAEVAWLDRPLSGHRKGCSGRSHLRCRGLAEEQARRQPDRHAIPSGAAQPGLRSNGEDD